ncbi:hypothetical protein MASR1M32_23040 [Rhodobacter sp.]
MSFSEIFIRRPVLSTVLAALILFLGLASVVNLPVRQYPEVDETVVTITTIYPGAAPELIQGFITSPIAAAVSTTEDIEYVTSSSSPSASVVTVQMKLGADPDIALTEVMSKVQQVRGQLPSDAEDPVIVKGTGMTFALMYLAVQNPNMTSEQLTEYLERVVSPRVTNIDGVAQMQIMGAAEYAMRVWLDPLQMAARGVTASDVAAAIRSSNFLSAPGKTENEYFVYSLTLDSTVQSADAFGALPLVQGANGTVRLRDVARIELASGATDAIVTFAGKPGIFIGIVPAPGENQLDVAENVLRDLPALRDTLPEGMTIALVYDSTETISASIDEVFKTIAEAVAIVVVVILLFLGSFRSVVMPVVTIPLSLIGVCSIMLALGYSINLLTLLAMVLAIGLVVDDAIVVVENIHRHIDEGQKPARAAIIGMKEITGPVIAMTITLAAVLSPLAFTGGLTGSLFTEFALTLAGSVVISGIVALTITPTMSARLLTHDAPGRFQRTVDRVLSGVSNWYERRVSSSLDYRPVTVLMVAVLLAVTGFMFVNTSSELAPEEDQGALFAILNAPRYASLDYTDAFTKEIGKRTADISEVQTSFSVAGMGGSAATGFYIWALKDWADRSRSQAEIQAADPGHAGRRAGPAGLRLRAALATGRRRRVADFDGAAIHPLARPRLRGGRGDPAEGDAIGQVHRGAEQPCLRRAAGQHRPSTATARPSWGLRSRHRGDAGDSGRRRLHRPVRPRFQQLRRDHAGAGRLAQQPREADRVLRALGHRADGAAVLGRRHRPGHHRRLDRAVQPAELGNAVGDADDRPFHQRVAGRAGADRGRNPARRVLHRLLRPVAAGEERRQHHPSGLWGRAGGDLSGAGGAVRKLPRPVHHHDVGAAVDLRRRAAAVLRGLDAEHLHPGRADHADRPDHEARHPDGGVRQPAARGARA